MKIKINKRLYKVETMRGTGKGGQHRNMTDSACRITHLETGLSSYADERSQHHSKKLAWQDLQRKLLERKSSVSAAKKKAKRDHAIHNTRTIRTYDFKTGVVKNHLNGKTASVKDVLEKGDLSKIQ